MKYVIRDFSTVRLDLTKKEVALTSQLHFTDKVISVITPLRRQFTVTKNMVGSVAEKVKSSVLQQP